MHNSFTNIIYYSLGARHDESSDCPSGTNIMSPYAFTPGASEADSYNRFSSCSVRNIQDHLAE